MGKIINAVFIEYLGAEGCMQKIALKMTLFLSLFIATFLLETSFATAAPNPLICSAGFHLEPGQGTNNAQCVTNNGFSAATVGVNLSQTLWNPVDFGEDATRRQISAAIHEAQLMGARTVRWISDMVWPFYKCSPDPENQLDGSIDPAFSTLSRILLDEAQKANVKVVITLFDPILAYGPSYGPKSPTVYSNSGDWIWGRDFGWIQGPGGYVDGGYPIKDFSSYGGTSCQNQGNAPITPYTYYGSTSFGPQTSQNALIYNASALKKLSTRFWNQVVILNQLNSQYQSLGAITLFNEPYPTGTDTSNFSVYVTSVMTTLMQYFPSIPFDTGIAWWEPQTLTAQVDSGAIYLGLNNYVGQHRYYPLPINYGSTTSQYISASSGILSDLFSFKNYIDPWLGNGASMPFVYEEYGGAGLPNSSSADLWNLINAGYAFHESYSFNNGIWFWTRDDWQDASGGSHEEIVSPKGNYGDAFRDRFANIGKETSYYSTQTVQTWVYSNSSWTQQSRQIQVGREASDSAGHLGIFGVSLALKSTTDSHWFRGDVRDGVFRRSEPNVKDTSARPTNEQRMSVPNVFVKSHSFYAAENPGWLAIVQTNANQYQFNYWECASTNQTGAVATPAYAQYQLLAEGWGVSPSSFWLAAPICPFSIFTQSGQL